MDFSTAAVPSLSLHCSHDDVQCVLLCMHLVGASDSWVRVRVRVRLCMHLVAARDSCMFLTCVWHAHGQVWTAASETTSFLAHCPCVLQNAKQHVHDPARYSALACPINLGHWVIDLMTLFDGGTSRYQGQCHLEFNARMTRVAKPPFLGRHLS